MTDKKPRICEHEEEEIKEIIYFYNFLNAQSISNKICEFINSKPCAKCSKKK